MNRIAVIAAGLAALTGFAAAPAHATFAGKNGRLVFERPIGRQIDLFTVKPSGSELRRRRLTRTRTWEERAEWSPDGQRLAFARSRPSGRPTEIWTMSATGERRRGLTTFGSTSNAPTWSPDGRIAFFTLRHFPPHSSDDDPPPPAEIHSMAQDGGDQVRLTNDKQIQTDPEWSPDGSTIAYSHWGAVPGEPGMLLVARRPPGRVHERPAARHGRLERLGPAFELYTMRAGARDVRRVTHNRVPDLHPDWQALPALTAGGERTSAVAGSAPR